MFNLTKTLRFLILVAGLSATLGSAASNIAGGWQFGMGTYANYTSIEQPSWNEYIFINEQGNRSSGERQNDFVVLREWALSGRIAFGAGIIEWSNGTYWHRNATLPSNPLNSRNLNTIFRSGICNQLRGACQMSVDRDGSLIFANEGTATSRGRIISDTHVVADDWHLSGIIVSDPFSGISRIFWENGVWWGQ